MFNLIKNNVIPFEKLIIDKYYKLNLDEVDAIILIRLHDLLSKNINVLNDEEVASSMKINKNEFGNRIVNLVNNGFITLELSSIDAKEIFSLDETYRRLSFLLEGEKQTSNKDIISNKIKETTLMLERELKKILSPIEREIVQRWYLEDGYSDEEIENAILNALKYKNRGINYIDRSLQAARRKTTTTPKENNSGENIQDLFNKIYASK